MVSVASQTLIGCVWHSTLPVSHATSEYLMLTWIPLRLSHQLVVVVVVVLVVVVVVVVCGLILCMVNLTPFGAAF